MSMKSPTFLVFIVLCISMNAFAAKNGCRWSEIKKMSHLSAEVELKVKSEFDLTGQVEVSRSSLIIASPKLFVWQVRKPPYVFIYHGDGLDLWYTQYKRGKRAPLQTRKMPIADSWIQTFAKLILSGKFKGYRSMHQARKDGACFSKWEFKTKDKSQNIPPFKKIEMIWKNKTLPLIQTLVLKEHMGTIYDLKFSKLEWKLPYSSSQLKRRSFVESHFR